MPVHAAAAALPDAARMSVYRGDAHTGELFHRFHSKQASMIHFTHAEIDHLITEDMPLHDETTRALDVPDVPGTLTYTARQPGVLAGLKPCLLMAQSLGLQAEPLAQDGAALLAQQPVLRLHGRAHALHVAWRQGMSVLEYLGGIASTTASMLRAARQVHPGIQLAATRKAFPGVRRWQQYAVLCGGGMVHRAGLSETILVFAQHQAFLPGLTVADIVRRAKAHSPEKFVMVEADDEAGALAAVHAGADGVQLDKMNPVQLGDLVPRLRQARSGRLVINAAGGIRVDNAAAYAATGVDILVTSHLYTAPAADYAAHMLAV